MQEEIVKAEMNVKDNIIRVMKVKNIDYISITDLAKIKNTSNPSNVIIHWLSNKNTVFYIGLWEKLNNENFNFTGFREIKINELGLNSFTMSPKKWIQKTNAIGLISKGGKYSTGTYAHPDIAFEFASWLSVEFKLYLVKEFERLKQKESYQNKIEWSIKRELARINYRIHTNSIRENIIPTLTEKQKQYVYANESDILNVALFGMTAKEWRDNNPSLEGNIRDYANVIQLVILINLENLNAEMIEQGMEQRKRIERLNEIAKRQYNILQDNKRIKTLGNSDKNNLKLSK